MARRRPEGRLEQLLSGATRVFIAKGYRRTQMADVAREMGVSPGALYGYVESKEVLVELYDLIERTRAGLLRRVPDPATVARLVLETITWFARHRLRDPDPATTDDATARATTIDFLLAGLIVPAGQRAAR